MVYDSAIIGSGPAGISAAINLKLLGKNFIWFSSGSVSKKVSLAGKIKNYPGLPDISGEDLSAAFVRHTDGMDIKPREEVVTGVYQTENAFTLLAGNEQYDAKTVILCLGVQAQKQLEGEKNFVGRGVSYCATCDGFLYKGKTLAILCTDKKFEHEVEYLAELSQKAYVFPMYAGYEIKSPKAEVILKSPNKVEGALKLEKVIYNGGEKQVDGMFILRGAVSPATLFHGLEIKEGHITVGRNCATNIAGAFAAGDCTGAPYQYVKAAGEGNVAAHSVVEYLSKNK